MKTKVSQIPKEEMLFIPGVNDWGAVGQLPKGRSFICFVHPMFLQGLIQAWEGKMFWED